MKLLYVQFIPISFGSCTPLYMSLSALEQPLKSFCESGLSNCDVFSIHPTEQNEGFGSICSQGRNKFDVYSSLSCSFYQASLRKVKKI
jgi:hypothetical protein